MEYLSKEWHPAVEEYCEAIFELDEDDLKVIQARIAERLSVSRAAVSEMINRLEKDGIVYTKDGRIHLTDDGQNLAQAVVRRHRLAERFLTDVLKLNWSDAHHEAGKWEHIISPTVEEAMNRILGEPTTCPHGNPIPGSDYVASPAQHLSELEVGDKFEIMRIPEELEFTPGMLTFLEDSDLTPGTKGKLVGTSSDGIHTVSIDGNELEIEPFAAERILVAN